MTNVNMYMLYVQLKKDGRSEKKQMTHLQFKIEMCEALLVNWTRKNDKKWLDEADMEELPPCAFLHEGKINNIVLFVKFNTLIFIGSTL
jgi:hypothetical protein